MKELSIEEKKLLFEDLCARLPYGVYIEHITTEIRGKLKGIVFEHIYNNTDSIQDINAWIKFFGDEYVDATYFRPILRPMSSMTEEERKYIEDKCAFTTIGPIGSKFCLVMPVIAAEWLTDFYNSHYLDWRGLIEKGLALEALGGMY